MTVFSNSQRLVDHCHDGINERFPLKRLVGINLIVGVTVTKLTDSIQFLQQGLITEVAEYTGQCDAGTERFPYPSGWLGFTADDCITNPEARAILDQWPYPNAVGMVAYVARCTRYDCLWLVAVLQRHFHNFGPAMIKALLRLVRFLFTTRSKPLIFQAGYPKDLPKSINFVDVSFASSQIDGTSHEANTNYHEGCPASASSKRQRIVALSSTESEFMAAHTVARDTAWREKYHEGSGMHVKLPVPILEDNTATIYLSRKHNLNGPRTRHMKTRWHWLQQQVLAGKVALHHLRTSFQVADVLTKGVDYGTFKRLGDVLLGHVPVWEYGNGALRRALDPSNALTREALAASNQHEREARQTTSAQQQTVQRALDFNQAHKATAASENTGTYAEELGALLYNAHRSGETGSGGTVSRRTNGAQEAAATMYGARYSGDVTGDGATMRVSTAAQEAAATMYGARYSGDVTGDGAGSIEWQHLRIIQALMHPDEPMPYTTHVSLRQMQLTANTLGGIEHAAEALLRNVALLPAGGDNDPTAGINRGAQELREVVNACAAMLYVEANRIAFSLHQEADGVREDGERNPPLAPASPSALVATMERMKVCNAPEGYSRNRVATVQMPPAHPVNPPPEYVSSSPNPAAFDGAHNFAIDRRQRYMASPAAEARESKAPEAGTEREAGGAHEPVAVEAKTTEAVGAAMPARHMTRAGLMAGMRCNPGARAWSISATQQLIASQAANPDTSMAKLAVTPNGFCFHHLSCTVLLCRKGVHQGKAFYGSVIIQPAHVIRRYNADRLGTREELKLCRFCQHSHQLQLCRFCKHSHRLELPC